MGSLSTSESPSGADKTDNKSDEEILGERIGRLEKHLIVSLSRLTPSSQFNLNLIRKCRAPYHTTHRHILIA